jgi:hypothetical protein
MRGLRRGSRGCEDPLIGDVLSETSRTVPIRAGASGLDVEDRNLDIGCYYSALLSQCLLAGDGAFAPDPKLNV